MRRSLYLTVAFLGTCGVSKAQVSFLVADRTADRVWIATDANGDGVVQGFELARYFDGSNAAGTGAPMNPNAIGFRRGLALIGDQDAAARRWTWARDLNGDDDALDVGESGVLVDATNPGGFSFAFPVGVTFDGDDRPVLVNAGNGFGGDDVFAVLMQPGDSDAMDSGEIVRFVTAQGFGSNGAWSPQEVAWRPDGGYYLRNSSSGLFGVYALRDTDNSGVIDRDQEFSVVFAAGNGAGLEAGAGFDLTVDPVRARSFYLMQVLTGAVDQVLRISDVNRDGDCMDVDEAVVVYTTSESGFTAIDTLALADGSLLVSDNSGPRVVRLRDLDGDGLFLSAGERADLVAGGISAARAMALVHDTGCGRADLAAPGGVLGGDGLHDNNDFIVFVNLFFTEAPLADLGGVGGSPRPDGRWDNNDFVVFVDAFFAGCD